MTTTSAEIERRVDAIVMRRLSTDRAYRNAASAAEQARREQEIADEVLAEVLAKRGFGRTNPNPQPTGGSR